MKTKTIILVLLIVLMGKFLYAEERVYKDFILTGPYTYNNLSLFLVKSDTDSSTRDMITLGEAIKSEKLKILETGNVQELALHNKCKTPVYIQGGDIVKGGQQDRVIRYDLVVCPEDQKLSLKSFCVESSRWSQRGDEARGYFNSSNNQVASKELKYAAKVVESQGEVWNEVDRMQDKLSGVVGVEVREDYSPSSLQLSLENVTLNEQTDKYIEYFNKIVGNDQHVVGFIFAISNEINSGDIYANRGLFSKMYPKLIEASAIEALSGVDTDFKKDQVTVKEIIDWLDEVENGEVNVKKINDNTSVTVKETISSISFDTFDKRFGDHWIHKNIIKK